MVRAPWGYGLHLVFKDEWNAMESAAIEGESPLHEVPRDEQDPEYCQTRGTWQEIAGTTPQG